MTFKFNCPHCNQKLEAEDEWIGQESECPGCGMTITIQKSVKEKKIETHKNETVKSSYWSTVLGEDVYKDNTHSSDESENCQESVSSDSYAGNDSSKNNKTDAQTVCSVIAALFFICCGYLAFAPTSGKPKISTGSSEPIVTQANEEISPTVDNAPNSLKNQGQEETGYVDKQAKGNTPNSLKMQEQEETGYVDEQTKTRVYFACFFVNRNGQKLKHNANVIILKGRHKIYQSFKKALNAKSKYAYSQRNARNAKASSSFDAFGGPDEVFKGMDAELNSLKSNGEFISASKSFLADDFDVRTFALKNLSLSYNGTDPTTILNVPNYRDIPHNTTITILAQAIQGNIVCYWCKVINTGDHEVIDMIFNTNRDCLLLER